MRPDRPLIGVVPLARSTFDVPYAEETARAAFATLDSMGLELAGPRRPLYDAAETDAVIAALRERRPALLLLLQLTFTDATMTVALGRAVDAGLLLWAFPEARAGGRLRLNSLCGINLAAHALGQAGVAYDYLYAQPADPAAPEAIRRAASGSHVTPSRFEAAPAAPAGQGEVARRVTERLSSARVGLFGRHPDGFTTCAADAARLSATTGTGVEARPLPELFAAAGEVAEPELAALRRRAAAELEGLDALDQDPLEKTLRSYLALQRLAGEAHYDALAVRCWPEFFTDYGCAACGAMARLNEDGVPSACEADVYGAVTALMLQELSGGRTLIADLVDLDLAGDTGVFWHCGLAPRSLADPQTPPRGTVHSNRRQPLLNEFALRPGRVTIARLSRSLNRDRLMLGGGEVLRAPMSFSGTSGVVRFDRPARAVLDTIMSESLEHHYALAYGDHREALRAVAAGLGLPVVSLD